MQPAIDRLLAEIPKHSVMQLCKASLAERKANEEWKTAVVVWTYISEHRCGREWVRSVNLTGVLGRCLERIIGKQISFGSFIFQFLH